MKKKKKQDESLYVKVLKFGSGRGWFSYSELLEELSIKEGSPDEKALRFQMRFKDLLHHNRTDFFLSYDEQDNRKSLHMGVEDEFRLLEHTELQEARASSRSATWFATAALIVSIVGTFSSVAFSVCERFGW